MQSACTLRMMTAPCPVYRMHNTFGAEPVEKIFADSKDWLNLAKDGSTTYGDSW